MLDEKKTEEALAALERASGKLDIVLARDPRLALAPIDVGVTTYAVYATLDAIKKAKEQAEDYLDDGEVQKAGVLIRDLAGNKKDYEKLYAEIEEIEGKTEGGKSGKGLFAKVKEHLSDF